MTTMETFDCSDSNEAGLGVMDTVEDDNANDEGYATDGDGEDESPDILEDYLGERDKDLHWLSDDHILEIHQTAKHSSAGLLPTRAITSCMTCALMVSTLPDEKQAIIIRVSPLWIYIGSANSTTYWLGSTVLLAGNFIIKSRY